MTAIQLRLPDDLAQASAVVARAAGVSRSEWIRQAIERELERARSLREKRAMAASLAAMRNDSHAARAGDALDEGLPTDLPHEQEGWWRA